MPLHDNLARIRLTDVEALSKASVSLSEAAATIKASKAAYVPAVIQLLREANDTILAVRDRGLARIQRYLARQDDRADQVARAKATPGESAPGDPGAIQPEDPD